MILYLARDVQKRRRRTPALIIRSSIICLFLSTTVLAQTVSRNDTVIFDLAHPIQDSDNFNWYTPGVKREHGAHQAMWEPLFLLDYATGELTPWLAESLVPVNPDNPVDWTLTLRRGVTWSDGKSFDGDDVAFTINDLVLKNDDLVAQEAVTMRQQLAGPVTVTRIAPGNLPRQVNFKLRSPNPRFDRESFAGGFFSSFMIMPQHVWQEALDKGKYASPAEFKFSKPIGTGPYKLRSNGQIAMIWERDNDWWGAKPPPGGGPRLATLPAPLQLEWRVLGSDAQSKAALEANDIDAGREMTPAAFADAKGRNPKIVGWDPASSLAWNDPCARQLDVNTLRPPWSDPRLRRAVSLLIDRAALAATAYQGSTAPSRTLFPEYGALKPVIDAVAAAGYGVAPAADPPAGAALLIQAGWTKGERFYAKDGSPLAVTILVDASQAKDLVAGREVARQLASAGIDAKAQEIGRGEYWGEKIPKGDYEMALSWLSCGSVAEPYTSLARYAADPQPIGVRSPGFNNTGRWQSQAAKDFASIVHDEIGRRWTAASNQPAVIKAYKHLHEEMPLIPLVQSPRVIPFSTAYWTGWPAKGGKAVPMHYWSATHRLIHSLRKAN